MGVESVREVGMERNSVSYPSPALDVCICSRRTLCFAHRPSTSNAVTCNLNFSVLLNFPKHTPSEMRFARGTEMACRMRDSRM